ncbi:zinc ribbon domain-containing protein [candidate division KSB1 bacterium]|nr:zinc ribbon domain-containing protein [candidate division KSB1 bacterium]
MPTYDYLCQDCGYRFDFFHKASDEPLEICPQCNGKVQRLISGGLGLIFKGSGFYITDYKNGKKEKKESVATETPAEKKSTDSKSTGSKDAA